jgi:hypothetical protein
MVADDDERLSATWPIDPRKEVRRSRIFPQMFDVQKENA